MSLNWTLKKTYPQDGKGHWGKSCPYCHLVGFQDGEVTAQAQWEIVRSWQVLAQPLAFRELNPIRYYLEKLQERMLRNMRKVHKLPQTHRFRSTMSTPPFQEGSPPTSEQGERRLRALLFRMRIFPKQTRPTCMASGLFSKFSVPSQTKEGKSFPVRDS